MIKNKRVIWRSMCVAKQDVIEFGPVQRTGIFGTAQVDDICRACGVPFDVGEKIELLQSSDPRGELWVHGTCPDPWVIMAQMTERNDPLLIVKYNPTLRSRTCAMCGTQLRGQLGWMVRLFRSLSEANHSTWICDNCKRNAEGSST